MIKPALFIGSSRENLPIAYAAQRNLAMDAEVSVWNQGIFRLMRYPLESLLEALHQSDFGLFVFAPDDVTRIRDAELQTPRDNVVFEFGLFVGRLGRERCFIIQPSGYPDFRLLSDLSGITPATYQPPRNRRRLPAELGPACDEIRIEMQTYGPLFDLSEDERIHLSNLAQGNTQGYQGRESLRYELRHLRSMGLVQSRVDRSIDDMRDDMEFDLAHYVELTDLGERYSGLQ